MSNKEYLKLPELNIVESNIDTWMFESQRLYEDAIQKYVIFKSDYITKQINYDNKLAEKIKSLKESGYKVTIIKEIAHSECKEEYQKMLEAEAQKKKYTMWITALENRINMFKYLAKRKWGELNG